MSQKNCDERNRWRNKTVAFRVSPEEDKQLETYVKLSGLTKQDYITRRLLGREPVNKKSSPQMKKLSPQSESQKAHTKSDRRENNIASLAERYLK